MHISSINNIQSSNKFNPHFTSCTRIYKPETVTNKNIFSTDTVRTTSNIFRYDEDWNFLMEYIMWNFVGIDKVNIYSLGCSDGSEAYTYAMYIYDKLPENLLKKYTPIFACDIDSEIIKAAKSGKINLSKYDIDNINIHLKHGKNYIKEKKGILKIKNNITTNEKAYEIIPEIRKMVEFKQSDILTELKKIEDEGNSVINIRNVFPYMSEKYANEVLETLAQKLKSGSIFVFGHYDHRIPNFRQRLHDLGFYSPVQNGNFVQKI